MSVKVVNNGTGEKCTIDGKPIENELNLKSSIIDRTLRPINDYIKLFKYKDKYIGIDYWEYAHGYELSLINSITESSELDKDISTADGKFYLSTVNSMTIHNGILYGAFRNDAANSSTYNFCKINENFNIEKLFEFGIYGDYGMISDTKNIYGFFDNPESMKDICIYKINLSNKSVTSLIPDGYRVEKHIPVYFNNKILFLGESKFGGNDFYELHQYNPENNSITDIAYFRDLKDGVQDITLNRQPFNDKLYGLIGDYNPHSNGSIFTINKDLSYTGNVQIKDYNSSNILTISIINDTMCIYDNLTKKLIALDSQILYKEI